MWQKIKEFSRKDPLIFTIIIALIIVGGGFGALQTMHKTSSAKFCKTCHQKQAATVRGEYYTWRKGVHSEVGVSCLDCHGAPGIKGYLNAHVVAGARSLYHELFTPEKEVVKHLTEYASTVHGAEHAASQESCMFCHADAPNKKMRRNRIIEIAGEFRGIDEVRNPEYREKFGLPDIYTQGVRAGVDPNHKAHMDAGLSCFSCHLGIGHSGERYARPKMETCFKCHDKVRATSKKIPANDDCAKCHVSQKGIQQGTFVKGVQGDKWYMADLSCTDCHDDAYTRPNSDKCASCHDDSYRSIMYDIQKSFKSRLAVAQKLRDKMMEERVHMYKGQRALANQIIYIVKVMEEDGSGGIHNPDYFDSMFDKIDELKKEVANYVEPVAKAETHVGVPQQAKEEHKEEAKPKGPVNSPELMQIVDAIPTINMQEKFVPNPTKPAVIFPHKDHASKFACTTCHAKAGEGELKFEVGEVKGMGNPFHKKLCITCHKKEHAKTSCNTCHSKK